MSQRVLDPIERTSEVLFGLIMVLTLTSSISVAEGGHAGVRSLMGAAIGCNLAWGLVDAVMYAMTNVMERGRGLAVLRGVGGAASPEAAHAQILAALPAVVAAVLSPADVENLRQKLLVEAADRQTGRLSRADLVGATAVFLLVFLSTLPIVVPFLVLTETSTALRLSNGIAALMLFLTGWSLGTHAGRPGWRTGMAMVGLGAVLVSITIVLGG